MCCWVRGQPLWTVTRKRKANWLLKTHRRKRFSEHRVNSHGVIRRKVANIWQYWASSVRTEMAVGFGVTEKSKHLVESNLCGMVRRLEIKDHMKWVLQRFPATEWQVRTVGSNISVL